MLQAQRGVQTLTGEGLEIPRPASPGGKLPEEVRVPEKMGLLWPESSVELKKSG